MMMSQPQHSKQCRSFAITGATAFKECTMHQVMFANSFSVTAFPRVLSKYNLKLCTLNLPPCLLLYSSWNIRMFSELYVVLVQFFLYFVLEFLYIYAKFKLCKSVYIKIKYCTKISSLFIFIYFSFLRRNRKNSLTPCFCTDTFVR